MKFMKSFADSLNAQPGLSRCEAVLHEKEIVAAGCGFMAAQTYCRVQERRNGADQIPSQAT
jgi:hypothetical protein